MHRRSVLTALAGVFLAACEAWIPTEPSRVPNPAPPSSQPQTRSLLQVLREGGYNAESRPYGPSGAVLVAINGDTNWNFYVDGRLIGIGQGGTPTLNVPTVTVPTGATWSVVRP